MDRFQGTCVCAWEGSDDGPTPALVTHFPTVSLRAGTPYAINRHLLNWTETLNSADNNHHVPLYQIHLSVGQILVPKPMYISHLPTQEPWTCPQEELSHSASQACWKILEIRDQVLVEVAAVTMETHCSTVLLRERFWLPGPAAGLWVPCCIHTKATLPPYAPSHYLGTVGIGACPFLLSRKLLQQAALARRHVIPQLNPSQTAL